MPEVAVTKVDALVRAREVSRRRREFQRAVADSDNPREFLAVTLEEGVPEYLHKMTLLAYLCMAPRVGRERAERMLERAQINPLSTVGRLTERELGVLGHVLRGD
jgi:hypothetical protein